MLTKNEIKYIQNLGQKKFRQDFKEFLIEGPKLTIELLQRKPDWLVTIYTTKNGLEKLPEHLQKKFENFMKIVEDFELEKISQLQTPQQILAVASLPNFSFKMPEKKEWILALDGIQDPGNLGTIIRTAHWFGIANIVCSGDCADAFSPKVVQASMGSILEVNICYENLEKWLPSLQVPVYGALLQGQNIFEIKDAKPGVILVGNEGRGISKALLPLVLSPITIPAIGNAESLNASVAAGILMGRFCRRDEIY